MSQMWGERLLSSAWHVVEKYGILYATSVLTKWASFKYTVAFLLFMKVHLHGPPTQSSILVCTAMQWANLGPTFIILSRSYQHFHIGWKKK